MENTIKRFIALIMIFLMSFSVITYAGGNNFTASAASSTTISIKKKPTVKASKIKATTVKLSWSKTKNATSYRVYRSTNKKEWTLVTKTKKTSYTLKNLKGNKTYYFKVRAYDSSEKKLKKSPYSKILTVKTKKNETVYATKKVVIREKASSKSKKLGTLKADKSIKRTATTSKGWSKVVYKGKTAYIKTNYLTTKKPETTTKEETTTEWKKEILTDENGQQYYYTAGGKKVIITGASDTTEVRDPSRCYVCGNKNCVRSMNDYYCGACKKTITSDECHSKAHFEKYY